jgi:hypothetical protein
MDPDPARDPRFISGIYNYCDRWCERCAFTGRCMNYALAQEVESGDSRLRDFENEAFRGELHKTIDAAMDMNANDADEGEADFNLDDEGLEESIREHEEIREAAESQPFSRNAMRYVEIADTWLKSNEDTLGDKDIRDNVEVVRWYHHLIWVKLCRAAGGAIRAEHLEVDYLHEDADGSAKVAIIGIERSMVAWEALQHRFPDHEDTVLALGTLKRLLRQVEAAFPNARAFRRPGFDTGEKPTG